MIFIPRLKVGRDIVVALFICKYIHKQFGLSLALSAYSVPKDLLAYNIYPDTLEVILNII